MTVAALPFILRPLVPQDRLRVDQMTRAVGLFWDYEIPIALEVFEEATGSGPSGVVDPDYESSGIEADGLLVGWAVWGPRPGAPGTFDLYWIVVHPEWQGAGLGRRLLAEMDRRIEGRVVEVVVETSGRADYEPARRFYERHGYERVGRIANHYGPGDDQLTYVRRVPSAECRVPRP